MIVDVGRNYNLQMLCSACEHEVAYSMSEAYQDGKGPSTQGTMTIMITNHTNVSVHTDER